MKYVFYVNVGNLPREKALKYFNRVIDETKAQGVLPKKSVLFVAVRDSETRIEALPS